MKKQIRLFAILLPAIMRTAIASDTAALPTPLDVWKDFDPDKGDFKEEIVAEETKDGIRFRDTYISAYVLGEEVRVYCKFAVKAGTRNAPGLLNIHGWMATANIDPGYVSDGWAEMSFDYCGDDGQRKLFTKYPEKMDHGRMKAKGIYSQLPDGKDIADPKQTSHYLWFAIQRRVLSYLCAQREVDKGRIGAKGYSYGGTLVWNLGMDPRVKAIVAYFGIGWIEYYRNKAVWMYNVPYREPPMTPGEKLVLATVEAQSHAPYITAASLWLNGSNDHHGGHERGGQTFKMFKPGVPWAFAIQARGHHDTQKLGDDCKLWLEKYVLGRDIDWPAHPNSEIKLDAAGVPELRVTPASPEKVAELNAYFALKEPCSFARAWRDAKAVREGDTWVAKMPVLNVDDYVFGFANIRYTNNIVVSSDFTAAIPSKLGKALATDKPSDVISEGTGQWSDVAPVEGVGGIQGFRPLNNQWGTTSQQFADPKWKAPVQAQLSFRFYCTQPQDLILVVNDGYETDLAITASDEWQTLVVSADKLLNRGSKAPLSGWSIANKIRIKPKPGADITKVIFAQFKWVASAPATIQTNATGRVYLTQAMASKAESFHHVSDGKSWDGNTIRVGGKAYERGLGVHAPSEIVIPLDGKYARFHVIPGPGDEHRGVIEMKILVDGKDLYASGKTSSSDGTPRKPIVIPVTAARTLTLIVTDGGDGNGGDHASWADAYLTSTGEDPATGTATAEAETLPPLRGGKAASTLEETWAGFNPRQEPLDAEILKEWEQDGVVLKVLRYRIGVFKGRKAMMAAVYGYPKGGSKLPGLVQIHGGGQYANFQAPLTNAKRGYATISIAWAGRISAPGYDVNPGVVQLFWDGKTNDPNYKLTTDWGALDGYHAPSRHPKTVFPSAQPTEWTLDSVESPRNSPWFLCALGARRALTFLEQQPEVDKDRLGAYGHSMGGKLTVMVAAADGRVKAAAPSCGGISDRDNASALFRAMIGDDAQLPHIACPIFFLSPANDFHGRIGDLPAAVREIKSGEWRVTCSPHHNHQDTAEYEVATQLWFDQHLKSAFTVPRTPSTSLNLKTTDGVPSFTVTPDPSKPIQSVDVFYTQQGDAAREARDIEHAKSRFWRHAAAVKKGSAWIADLPLFSGCEPLWAYANVVYALEKPVAGAGYYYGAYTTDRFNVSSLMQIATADDMKAAGCRATLKPSPVIEAFEDGWQEEWFTYRQEGWGRSTHKVYDRQWAAPVAATLSLDVRAERPNKLVVGLDGCAAEVALPGGPEWRTVALRPADFRDADGNALPNWTGLKELRLGGQETLRSKKDGVMPVSLGGDWRGASPEFRNLRWERGEGDSKEVRL
jgi:dienelactone hydrolase